MNIDVRVRLEPGSNLVLVELETPAAEEWVHDHVPDPMTFGKALVVEGRYLDNLINGMQAEFLVVTIEGSDNLIIAGG